MLKKVVVTGASGFVGQAVCLELSRRTIPFIAVTRKSGFRFPKNTDVLELKDFSEIPAQPGAVCIHLAGESSVAAVKAQPKKITEETLTNIRILKSLGFEKIIFISSSMIYGAQTAVSKSESDELHPETDYGKMKLLAEHLFHTEKDVIARLSNLYGTGMSPENVFSDILSQVQSVGPICMRNLNSVRDYLHVDDAAHAIVELVVRNVSGTYNVGTGVGTSVSDLVKLLFSLTGYPVREMIATDQKSTNTHLVLNPLKIQQDLHWKASISIREGLDRLIHERKKS